MSRARPVTETLDDRPPAATGDFSAEVRRLILNRMPSCRLEDLSDDTPLLDGVGFDSVRLVELLYACEDRFGVELPLELLEQETPTVGALIRQIVSASGLPDADDPGSGEG